MKGKHLPRFLESAIRRIEQQLQEPIQAQEIAAYAGLSLNRLNHYFKVYFNTTVKQYIINRRMNRAQHLICATSWKCKEVAEHCGMPDPQAFNKTFRKHFSCSPTEFREKQLMKNVN